MFSLTNLMPDPRGVLCDPNDSDAIAQTIYEIWQQPDRMQQIEQNAQAWIHEHFSAEHVIADYVAAFKRFLDS